MSQRYKDSYSEQLHNKMDNTEEMDEILETCNLPRLHHEKKRENLNKVITS